MIVSEFSNILKDPKALQNIEQTKQLEELLKEYPYFQAAHALYIKGLKNQNSHKYNKALKEAAAHSTDRTILFNFITSKEFNSTEVKEVEQSSKEKHLKEETSQTDQLIAKNEILVSSQPLDFKKSEMHSFATWLELTSSTPLEKETPKKTEKRSKKTAQIEAFLKQKPKIKPQKDYQSTIDINQSTQIDEREIMTETLARVYLDQKKYNKAIQAYTILSLKYPEKNSFFAAQIKAIKKSQKEK